MGRRTTAGWRAPGQQLDPLALLLRSRFDSRADLARASGLGYQTLRTYTDGRWTAGQEPSRHVLAALAQVIPADELRAAVDAALQVAAGCMCCHCTSIISADVDVVNMPWIRL